MAEDSSSEGTLPLKAPILLRGDDFPSSKKEPNVTPDEESNHQAQTPLPSSNYSPSLQTDHDHSVFPLSDFLLERLVDHMNVHKEPDGIEICPLSDCLRVITMEALELLRYINDNTRQIYQVPKVKLKQTEGWDGPIRHSSYHLRNPNSNRRRRYSNCVQVITDNELMKRKFQTLVKPMPISVGVTTVQSYEEADEERRDAFSVGDLRDAVSAPTPQYSANESQDNDSESEYRVDTLLEEEESEHTVESPTTPPLNKLGKRPAFGSPEEVKNPRKRSDANNRAGHIQFGVSDGIESRLLDGPSTLQEPPESPYVPPDDVHSSGSAGSFSIRGQNYQYPDDDNDDSKFGSETDTPTNPPRRARR